jgi:hypothetical protein
MPGRAISIAFRGKIEEVGIFTILERVEKGDALQNIAKSLGMSRPFLSTFLNRDRVTRTSPVYRPRHGGDETSSGAFRERRTTRCAKVAGEYPYVALSGAKGPASSRYQYYPPGTGHFIYG